MDFGVCKIIILEKNITYHFNEDFVKIVNNEKFEQKLKKSELPSSSCWRKDSVQTKFIKKSSFFLFFKNKNPKNWFKK